MYIEQVYKICPIQLPNNSKDSYLTIEVDYNRLYNQTTIIKR